MGGDEAGKGPVVGSMFVCGVALDESRVDELVKLGVRDSKLLSPKRREKLAAEIRNIADVYVVELKAAEIDRLRMRMTINDILADAYARVIEALHPDHVILDCPDVNLERFERMVSERLKGDSPPVIVCRHKAEGISPLVAAASIVAKVERDESIRRLERRIGMRIGSGYPSDPVTREFLLKVQGSPSYIRMSWETAKALIRKKS